MNKVIDFYARFQKVTDLPVRHYLKYPSQFAHILNLNFVLKRMFREAVAERKAELGDQYPEECGANDEFEYDGAWDEFTDANEVREAER